ncbi:hypothetical protein [Paenibacillus taiwanensis]|uniref:hypothetical protein n=1 Tax=Paenibacillus taiwanensis TaxID=401638 RepID=UPI000427CB37|nr:hypothetical protein [Paenibacillus taiwanensis]
MGLYPLQGGTPLVEKPPVSLELKPGVQVVEAEEDSLFKLSGIQGRTLINLLGNKGACEAITEWIPWQTICTVESASFKVSLPSDANGDISTIVPLEVDKYYVLVGDVKNGNAEFIRLQTQIQTELGSEWFAVDATSTQDFQTVYSAFHTMGKKKINFSGVHVTVYGAKSGMHGYVDHIRIYEINSDQYQFVTENKLQSEEISRLYPFVNGMMNVLNPYQKVISGNMCPSFVDWSRGLENRVISPYTLHITSTLKSIFSVSPLIRVRAGQVFHFSCTVTGDGQLAYQTYNCKKQVLNSYQLGRGTGTSRDEVIGGTLTVTEGTHYIAVRVGKDVAASSNKIEFMNPMLSYGSFASTFCPQHQSIWAAECSLASYPVDGSSPDELYIGNDGKPYVIEHWKKIVFDQALSWFTSVSKTGYKEIGTALNIGYRPTHAYLNRPDGLLLSYTPSAQEAVNCFDIAGNGVYLNLTIPNSLSGWGDNYSNPSKDEIMACLLGYKMYVAGGSANIDFNGVGTKAWAYHRTDGEWQDVGVNVPTVPAPEWTFFQLQYAKSSPTVEQINCYELGSKLMKGTNLVEIGSGIVIREKVSPAYNSALRTYGINAPVAYGIDSILKYKSNNIEGIYRNDSNDKNWFIIQDITQSYGESYADIYEYHFDHNAEYRATYLMTNPTLSSVFRGSLVTNLHGSVSRANEWLSRVEKRLSILENNQSVREAPHWIVPTLINGWLAYNVNIYGAPSYFKDCNGIIRMKGAVKSGAFGELFRLPKGYRPKNTITIILLSSNGVSDVVSGIDISAEGKVSINRGASTFISLNGVSFLTEQ